MKGSLSVRPWQTSVLARPLYWQQPRCWRVVLTSLMSRMWSTSTCLGKLRSMFIGIEMLGYEKWSMWYSSGLAEQAEWVMMAEPSHSLTGWTMERYRLNYTCKQNSWMEIIIVGNMLSYRSCIFTERSGAHLEAVRSNSAGLPQTATWRNLQGQQDTQGNKTSVLVCLSQQKISSKGGRRCSKA